MSYPEHSLGGWGFSPLCREAVGVFYSPSQLGNVLSLLFNYLFWWFLFFLLLIIMMMGSLTSQKTLSITFFTWPLHLELFYRRVGVLPLHGVSFRLTLMWSNRRSLVGDVWLQSTFSYICKWHANRSQHRMCETHINCPNWSIGSHYNRMYHAYY